MFLQAKPGFNLVSGQLQPPPLLLAEAAHKATMQLLC